MEIAKTQTSKFYKKILIAFSICVVAIFALIIYFSLSKTVINITLQPQSKSTTFAFTVKKELNGTNTNTAAADVLPGYLVSTTVEASQEFANDQTGDEVPAQATGQVTIYNNWNQVQPLAATTRLLTSDGILFHIKNRVDVPAGGKLENVEVYADQPGTSGNIGPAKFTIPGLWPDLQQKIYAESTTAMTGGLRKASVITAAILAEAKKTLEKKLAADAVAKLSADTEAVKLGDNVSEQNFYNIILSESSTAKEGEEASAFTLTMKVRIIAVIFNQELLANLAANNLKQELAQDIQINNPANDTLVYSVTAQDLDNQTASLQATYTADTVPRLSSPIFNRDKITGQDSQAIKAYFSNFDEIKSVDIKFSPFWVTKAPKLKDHIEIKISQ